MFGVLIGGTVAYWRGQSRVVSKLTMGTLDGALVTQQAKSSGVYPGDSVEASASVVNAGGLDLIARLKVEPEWENNANGALKNDAITLNYNLGSASGQWMDGKDGYFYYRGILQAGQTTPKLYNSFTISAKEADNEYFGRTANIKVTMECLQATANAVKMWNKTYADLGLSEPKPAASQKVTVTLNKDKKFVFPGGGLLFELGKMAPGEMREQAVVISNESQETIQFFLRGEVDSEGLSSTEKDRLDRLLKNYTTLVISDSTGKTVYRGPVTNASQQDVTLASLEKGKQETYTLSVLVDSQAGNEFQGVEGKIRWVFTAQGEDGNTTTGGGKLPQTGGMVHPWALLGGASALVLAVLLLLLFRIRQKRQETQAEDHDAQSEPTDAT